MDSLCSFWGSVDILHGFKIDKFRKSTVPELGQRSPLKTEISRVSFAEPEASTLTD